MLNNIDKKNIYLPDKIQHIAIIMDGNFRWAKNNNYTDYYGHYRGSKIAKDIIKICVKMQLKHLSLYLFSMENWNRPEQEIKAIFQIYLDYLNSRKERQKLMQNNIKVFFLGSSLNLDQNLIEKMQNLELATKNNTGMHLYILFNYSGKEEILDMTKKIVKQTLNKILGSSESQNDFNRFNYVNNSKYVVDNNDNIVTNFTNINNFNNVNQSNDISNFNNNNIKVTKETIDQIIEKDITKELISNNMYCSIMPQIDLLIRTGNRNRVSNMLPWHITYSEIAFIETLWPDFTENEFTEIIHSYADNVRTFGARVFTNASNNLVSSSSNIVTSINNLLSSVK